MQDLLGRYSEALNNQHDCFKARPPLSVKFSCLLLSLSSIPIVTGSREQGEVENQHKGGWAIGADDIP